MHHTQIVMVLCVALFIDCSNEANGQPSPPFFAPIPSLPGNDYCVPYAISDDGSVIVGECPHPGVMQAFYFTEKEGTVGMGLVEGAYGSAANAVSTDGSVIVGSFSFLEPNEMKAFRWTRATGYQILPKVPLRSHQRATGVSGDGSIVVGAARNNYPAEELAFRWTAQAGLTTLVSLAPNPPSESRATAISANGAVIVGMSDPWWNSHRPVRWTSPTSVTAIGSGPGPSPSVSAVSGNGSVIVGSHKWRAAYYWYREDIPGFQYAFSISNDGSVIVGRGWAGSVELDARIWTSDCGTRKLRDMLLAAGLNELTPWKLYLAYDIASDNRTIVGTGLDPFGKPQGFRARLPLTGDMNFDGRVNVTDLLHVITNWGPCASCTFKDINCDGAIDQFELMAVVQNWNA